jgi:hypothetical protein
MGGAGRREGGHGSKHQACDQSHCGVRSPDVEEKPSVEMLCYNITNNKQASDIEERQSAGTAGVGEACQERNVVVGREAGRERP